jgi:hypothetical protein
MRILSNLFLVKDNTLSERFSMTTDQNLLLQSNTAKVNPV